MSVYAILVIIMDRNLNKLLNKTLRLIRCNSNIDRLIIVIIAFCVGICFASNRLDDPVRHRMLFEPTALTIPKGQFLLDSRELFFWSVGYGVAERISIEFMIPMAHFSDLPRYSIGIVPKINLESKSYSNLAAGPMLFSDLCGKGETVNFGFYIAATFDKKTSGVNFYLASIPMGTGRNNVNVAFIGVKSKFSNRITGFLTIYSVYLDDKVRPTFPFVGLRFHWSTTTLDIGVVPISKYEYDKLFYLPYLGFTKIY